MLRQRRSVQGCEREGDLSCLTLLCRIHDLVDEGGQFIIATHSPLLMAYPDATIYELDDLGLEETSYDGTRQVSLYRGFLASPEAFLRHLLE